MLITFYKQHLHTACTHQPAYHPYLHLYNWQSMLIHHSFYAAYCGISACMQLWLCIIHPFLTLLAAYLATYAYCILLFACYNLFNNCMLHKVTILHITLFMLHTWQHLYIKCSYGHKFTLCMLHSVKHLHAECTHCPVYHFLYAS